MSEPSHSPEARIRALMDVTQSLSAIFAEENELLENQRPRDIAPLQAEKTRLAAVYAQSIREVARARGEIQSADNTLLAELREITVRFEARAARQRALLDGARKASEGVVRAIAEEAAAQSGQAAYGGEADTPAAAAPVSVNESA